MGLAGESGELVDHLKKYCHHGHQLDIPYIEKEIGDIFWYCAVLAEDVGLDLHSVLQVNIDKLKKRYPEGFSSDASINRTN